MKIAVIGAGHVGLVTGACFAEMGYSVTCVDRDKAKIASCKKLQVPFYEPGLLALLKKNVKAERLTFTTAIRGASRKADAVFIAVGTPMRPSGEADLIAVEAVATEIARSIEGYTLIVEKSTVPVLTGQWVHRTIKESLPRNKKVTFDVASNPEFLREGTAVEDFMKPDRVVIGVESKRAEQLLREIYKPLNAKMVVTDVSSAEIIKHASNSFLSTKISFINMISRLCEKTGADVNKVAHGIGMDRRIGPGFLNAGIGFGGFCFPKDIAAFIYMGEKEGVDMSLLRSVESINTGQRAHYLAKIKEFMWNLRGKKVAVLGLAFKPDTDDMRFAPAIEIIEALQDEGANICAFDPVAAHEAKAVLKGITYAKNAYDAAKGADALLLLTEWQQFRELDYKKVRTLMKKPLIFDGRNMFEPEQMRKLKFQYVSMGRQPVI